MSVRIAEAAIVFSAITGPLVKDTRQAVAAIHHVDKAAASVGRSGGVDHLRKGIAEYNRGLKESATLTRNLRGVAASPKPEHLGGGGGGGGGGLISNVGKGIIGGATFGLGLVAVEATEALSGMLGDSVDLAAQFERTTLSFETMLGSASAAQEMLGKIKTFAADSPLTLTQATDASKQLIAYGIATDQIVPTLRALTDIASGTGAELGRLTLAYGQVATAGRLYGTELRQFTEAGVPIIDALATALGKPKEQIKSLVEDGKVGFNDLVKAMKGLTEGSGKFAGMTEKYAGSLSGQMDRLRDSIETVKREVGTAIIEETGLKDATADMTAFTDSIKGSVSSLRPAIRLAGDLIKAGAQGANELGRFIRILAEVRLEKLTQSLPGLKEAPAQLQKILRDLQDFKLDPVAAGEFAITLAQAGLDALSLIEDGLVAIGADTQKNLVDPIVEGAKSLKGVADQILHILKEIAAIKNAVTNPGAGLQDLNEKMSGGKPRSLDTPLRIFPGAVTHPDHLQPPGPFAPQSPQAVQPPVAPEMKPQPKPLDGLRAAILPRMEAMKAAQEKDRLAKQQADMAGSKFNPFAALAGPAMNGLAFAAKETSRELNELKEVANIIPSRLIDLADKLNKEFAPKFQPLAQFSRDIGDVEFMRNRSLINDDVMALSTTDLYRNLTSQIGGIGELKLPQLMEVGSREASRLEMSAIGGGTGESVLSVLQSIQRAAEEELQQARDTDRAIQRALSELGVKVELPTR